MGTHPIFESDFDCLTERSKMEIDLVVQKRLKPNSMEIETLLMEPNEPFWIFASEIQPSDITSSCFDEELDILQNEEVVGNLKVSVKRDTNMDIDGINVPVLSIYAETKAQNEEFEIFQSIESKVTADLNLIKETKIENTQLLTKSVITEYHQGHGYKMKRVVEQNHQEDTLEDDWQENNFEAEEFEMSFLCDSAKSILSDGTAIFIQRLLPKIGVYKIELPYLDIDSKLVSLSSITALGFKPSMIDGQEVDLVGLQRTHHLKYGPHVYNLWLFEDGHIASRESDGGKVQLQVSKMPQLIKDEDDLEPVIKLPPLNWHDDMQLKSIYRQKASQLSSSHASYLKSNDKMTKQLRDFYTSVLEHKPADIYAYAANHFNAYADQ